MTWREDLRRVTLFDGRKMIGASFRGVPFFVDSADRTGGRRAVVHEFPGRDDPFVQDLGRKARTFAVDGYMLGDGYLTQRDALLEALEDEAGPGTLVHPYFGVRRAICTGLTVRETKADGGMSVFSLEFTETPAQAVDPTDEIDLAEKTSASATAARAATQAEFDGSYDIAEMPAFGLATAQATLTAITERLGAALAPVVATTQELARLNVAVRSITGQAKALVRTPASVLGAFGGALETLVESSIASPGAVLGAFMNAYAAPLPPLATVTTATRARERANQIALAAALRQILAIEAARLVPLVPFVTLDDANSTRDAVVALLDEQAATAGDDAYPALIQLRADLVRAVPGDAVLARVVNVERLVTLPSLLLSYQLYGSVEQELDIVARNRIRHPGLVAGTVQVLTE